MGPGPGRRKRRNPPQTFEALPEKNTYHSLGLRDGEEVASGQEMLTTTFIVSFSQRYFPAYAETPSATKGNELEGMEVPHLGRLKPLWNEVLAVVAPVLLTSKGPAEVAAPSLAAGRKGPGSWRCP